MLPPADPAGPSQRRPLVRHACDDVTGVHHVILDRPDARNAISRQLLHDLDDALDAVLDACAAPSPTVAALAWKRTQARASSSRDLHPLDSKAAGAAAAADEIASLEWPTPPPSRRGSTVAEGGPTLAMSRSSSHARHHIRASSTAATAATATTPPDSSPSSRSSSDDVSPAASPARCLILQSSSAKAFCSGADLAERRTMSHADIVGFLTRLRQVVNKLDSMPIPTIAAIDGPALGGGLELALACDFRTAGLVAAPARSGEEGSSSPPPLRPLVGFPECQLGILPGAGGTQRATRLLGVSRAKSLIFTGRILDARQAYDWGLVEYLADDEPGQTAVDKACTLAAQMQGSAPLSLAAAKAAIDVGGEMADLQRGLDWEAACYRALLPSADRQEALIAFAEKRKPNFVGR